MVLGQFLIRISVFTSTAHLCVCVCLKHQSSACLSLKTEKTQVFPVNGVILFQVQVDSFTDGSLLYYSM